MSINKNFCVHELIEKITEINTSQNDTIDDLIFELAKCKQDIKRDTLPSISEILKSKSNNTISITKMVKSKENLKKVIGNAGIVGSGVSCLNDLYTLFEFITNINK